MNKTNPNYYWLKTYELISSIKFHNFLGHLVTNQFQNKKTI